MAKLSKGIIKSWFLAIILVFVAQNSFQLPVAIAAGDEEKAIVLKGMADFTDKLISGDIDGAMAYISEKYNDQNPDGETVDYNKYKDILKEKVAMWNKKYLFKSHGEFTVTSFEADNEEGLIAYQFKVEVHDIVSDSDETLQVHNEMSLTKEDGYWKVRHNAPFRH
jgi:hypothetical protein